MFLSDAMPAVWVNENSHLFSRVLQLCLSGVPPSLMSPVHPGSPAHLLDYVVVAEKYQITHELPHLMSGWTAIAERYPLHSYLAAARAGHSLCAQVAAKAALHTPSIELYTSEMEGLSALMYHRLVKYHDACRTVVKGLLLGACPDSRTSCSHNDGTPCADRAATRPMHSSGSSSAWVRDYVAKLVDIIDDRRVGGVLSPEPTPDAIFVRASESRQLCESCQSFVDTLSQVACALRDISAAVDRVSRSNS